MLSDEEKEVALVVLGQLVNNSNSNLTTLDDEPFLILEGWNEVDYFNEELNARLNPTVWAIWRPLYVALNKIKEDGARWPDRPFERLRLGRISLGKLYQDSWRLEKRWDMLAAYQLIKDMVAEHGWLTDYCYQIPDGLVEIDDVVECGFSDEYDSCINCGKAIRTAPDSYGWLLMADFIDCEGYLCSECVDPAEYLKARVNRNRLVNDALVDPAAYGWERLDEHYRNNWHGADDDPKKIIPRLNKFGYDVIFTGNVAQFGIGFYAWVRPKQEEENED